MFERRDIGVWYVVCIEYYQTTKIKLQITIITIVSRVLLCISMTVCLGDVIMESWVVNDNVMLQRML